MKLPLYHYKNKKVVIWHIEHEQADFVKEVYVEYSVLTDSGDLSDRKSRTIPQWEFTEHFELQPEQVEINWSRIVPQSEAK